MLWKHLRDSRWLLAALLPALIPLNAWAHADMLTHRPGETIAIAEDLPCSTSPGPGPVPAPTGKSGDPSNFTAGVQLTIATSEYIHHTGQYFVNIATIPNPTKQSDFSPLTILSAYELDTNTNKQISLTVGNIPWVNNQNNTQSGVTGDLASNHPNGVGINPVFPSLPFKYRLILFAPRRVSCNSFSRTKTLA